MLTTLLGIAALIFLAYLFFTLFLRMARSRSLAVKLLGGLLSGALTLAFVAATAAALYGVWLMDAPRSRSIPDLPVDGSPEQVSRGKSLSVSCALCHSSDGSLILNGGLVNLAASLGPYGRLYGTNLTPGGEISHWSDGEIGRAIRDGLDDKGRPLMVHPSVSYHSMSDQEVADLVAYLRSLPALRHDQPMRDLNVLARMAVAAGILTTSEPASR